MERIAKMDYEIDPNSPFNKLKKLQVCLKEEVSLLELFYNEKEEILKKINNDCYEYYKNIILIMEIYDKMNNIDKNKSYEIIKNTNIELSQLFEVVNKFFFYIRNNYPFILKLIDKIDKNNYEKFANFFCNYFYTNIISSDSYEESLFALIIFLLAKEIRDINNNSSEILNIENSFCGYLLKHFLRKIDIKLLMKSIFKDFENIIKETNKDYGIFVGFEFNKIKNFIHLNKMNKLKRIVKNTDSKLLLLNNITKSKLVNYQNDNLYNENEEIENSFFYYYNKDKKDYTIFEINKDNNIKEFEQYLINSNIYSFPNYIKKEINEEEINKNYHTILNKNWLISYGKEINEIEMQQFIFKQVFYIEANENIYTNVKLFEELSKMKEKSDIHDKIILLYKYQFEKIKNIFDALIISIIKNIYLIPYNIKCICVIIDKLILKKNKMISLIDRNTFLGYFFFNILFCTIIDNPKFNGILINLDNKEEINVIITVLKKLSKGLFFNSFNPNEVYFTLFNHYFLEIEPFIIKIFESLRNIYLPKSLEKIIENINFNDKNIEMNYNYNYIEYRPEERVDFQSICFTYDILFLMCNIIKENGKEFDIEKNNIFSKYFKKLIFLEKTINKKLENDMKNNKKTFIYITNPIFDKNLEEIMKKKKNKKFNFQTNESLTQLNNEKFILERIKYCINILVKNLNPLTRENYFIQKGENEEDFALALNKILELEGFSDMLKEQTIPLNWFGLYLQSNISNIPIEYKRQKYLLLLNELIDDTQKNILNLKNDDSLNYLYIKSLKSQKNIYFNQKYLEDLNNEKMYSNIYEYIKNGIVKVFIIEHINNKNEIIQYEIKTNDIKTPFKKYICETINQFILIFPNIIETRDIDNYFEYEIQLNIPHLLKEYLVIISEHITSNDLFKNFQNPYQKKIIKTELTNYIYNRLYHKLYNPAQPSQEDLKIYQNCFMYDWIKPENIIENFTSINENILSIAIYYINKINNVKSPIEKIECLKRIDEIILNVDILYGYPNNKLNIFLYLIIKAHPNFFNTDINYINLYLPYEYNKGRNNQLLSIIKFLINKLLSFSFNDIIGMTEDEYNNIMNLK